MREKPGSEKSPADSFLLFVLSLIPGNNCVVPILVVATARKSLRIKSEATSSCHLFRGL